MPLPDFFIAGAPKAGTDLLYYQLDQHPEIFMSPLKEPCFFSTEVRLDNFHPGLRERAERGDAALRRYLDAGAREKRFGGIVAALPDYEILFAGAGNHKRLGEGSVCYLWSATAASEIARALPHARILLVLMDPAERAFRQYLKSLSNGDVAHSFHQHLQLALKEVGSGRSQISPFHPFLAFGEYSSQVQRYLDHFPADQLFISLHEDSQDYAPWFAKVLHFLDVDANFAPPEVDVPSEPHVPKFPRLRHALKTSVGQRVAGCLPEMFRSRLRVRLNREQGAQRLTEEDRSVLIRYYKQDILRLQDMIGRDLSAWLC